MRSLFTLAALSLTLGSLSVAQVQTPPVVAVTPAARVLHPPIDEMSGIVKSRRYPNTFWIHNDSGDSARLFAVHADGTVVVPPFLRQNFTLDAELPPGGKPVWPGLLVSGTSNSDREDVTLDGDMLYIADVGNNGNARRDLAVYMLPEPNPQAVGSAHVLKRLPVAYPDQTVFPDPKNWHFDCEAVFVVRHKLYFLTKHRAPGKIDVAETGANLYRLNSEQTDKVNVLKKVDAARDLGGWVTAANVSPNGKTLAVLCESPIKSVWLFDISGKGDKLLSRPTGRLVMDENAKQCEAICWDDDATLMVGNEQRDLFRLNVRDFGPAKQEKGRRKAALFLFHPCPIQLSS